MTHGTSLFFDVTCHALQQAVISNLPMLSCAPPHGQTTLSLLVRVATQLCCLLVAPEILQNKWCFVVYASTCQVYVVGLRIMIRCCQRQGPDEAAARLVDGILRRKSFYFQQRSGKLDMRAIGRVDIDSVVKDVDIDTLQVRLSHEQ